MEKLFDLPGMFVPNNNMLIAYPRKSGLDTSLQEERKLTGWAVGKDEAHGLNGGSLPVRREQAFR